MAGVIILVCIPSQQYELQLRQKEKTKGQKHHKSSTAFQNESTVNQDHDKLQESPMKSQFKDSVLVINDMEDEPRDNLLKTYSKEHLLSNTREAADDRNTITKSWEGIKGFMSSARKRRKPCVIEDDKDDNNSGKLSLQQILKDLLKDLKIENAVWCKAQDLNFLQIIFSIESTRCDEVLQAFNAFGIGVRNKSVVSVVPCTLFYQSQNADTSLPTSDFGDPADPSKKEPHKDSAWNRFMQSARARLTVAQVVERVKADATLTFDFVITLTIAAFMAAIGLVEDSTVFLVSSMLISPLMGPVMAGTFGTVLYDRQLQKLGIINELLGLLLTTFIGFLFGLVIASIGNHYGVGDWPTNEMISKCEIRSLWVGALIALPSGAAVAVAILGGNTGSLVGVAISASLLPPAVNAGLLWAMALVYLRWEGNDSKNDIVIETFLYSDNQTTELAVLGAISLCLTFVNIVCIYAGAVIVFKIKEVTPINSKSLQRFWRDGIKIARDYNKTLHGDDAMKAKMNLANEMAEVGESKDTVENSIINSFSMVPRSWRLIRSAEPANCNVSSMVANVVTVPSQRLTLQEIEALYASLMKDNYPTPPISTSSGYHNEFSDPTQEPSTETNTWSTSTTVIVEELPVTSKSHYSSEIPRFHNNAAIHRTYPYSSSKRVSPTLFKTKKSNCPKKFIVTRAEENENAKDPPSPFIDTN